MIIIFAGEMHRVLNKVLYIRYILSHPVMLKQSRSLSAHLGLSIMHVPMD